MTEIHGAQVQWVDTIDVRSDHTGDNHSERGLKEQLKKDLQLLWERKNDQRNGQRITESEYLRYVNMAKSILEKQDMQFAEIRKEYFKQRKLTLENSNTFSENLSLTIGNSLRRVRNIGTDAITNIEQKLISEDTLQAYSDGEGNTLITIKDFEEQLKKKPFDEINGLAMRNYFIYLKSKGLLNKSVLEEKCGGSKRLLELSIIWGSVLEGGAQVRNAIGKNSGFLTKLQSSVASKVTFGAESAGEQIFKEVIIQNIKKTGIEKMTKTGEKTKIQSLEKLDSMKYDAIIEEMLKVFGAKKGHITSKMIKEFWETQVPQTSLSINTPNVPGFGINNGGDQSRPNDNITHIPGHRPFIPNSQSFFESSATIFNSDSPIKDTKATLRKTLTLEAASHTNEENISLREKQGLYKETLESIGYTNVSISAIYKDKKILKEILGILEKKGLIKTELYKDLKSYFQIEEDRADNYIIITQGITTEELSTRKKKGQYDDNFIDEIYNNDVRQKKTTEFTVPQAEKEQKYTDTMKKNNIESTLASLSNNGEKVFLKEIGSDTCFIKKEGEKFTLSINGREEICTNPKEIENTISTYKFFHDMGLKSLIPSMKPFLATVKNSNPICPDFDVQKGIISGEQKNTLLHAIDTIFDLNMKEKIIATGKTTIISDFKDKINGVASEVRLRGKGILTAQGEFNQEKFNRLLMTKTEVL